MGRFLNSRAIAEPPGPRLDVSPLLKPPAAALEVDAAPPPVIAPTTAAALSSPVTTVGLYALCVYLIAGYATDLSYRFLGTKPYVSMVSGILVFVCFLISGQALAALRTTVGKLWLALGVWMCLAVVFSRWRSGSLGVMEGYLPKQHMVLFYMASFALTIKQCRSLLRACILGGFILILTCVFFGGIEDSGRFVIPTNIFLSNPNDLSMQLLLCLGFFVFLIRQPGNLGRIAGLAGVVGAGFYLLKTGSRGGVLAAIVLTAICVFFSANRMKVLVAAAPMVLVLFALMPHDIVHRLALIGLGGSGETAQDMEDSKTQDSANERRHLFIESLKYTIKNPIFGIGPGRFADAIWEDGKKEGRHEVSLGTHNTYTQIGAECGVPALSFFLAAVFITVRNSYRLYRATARDPALGVMSAIAFTCFALSVAFSIDVFFHHMAFSGNMAMVLGLWVATESAARAQGIEFGRRQVSA
jgi:O-antigen ligase